MNKTSIAIIKALLKLASEGTFTCTLDGIDKVAALSQAANNHVAALEAAEVLEDD